MRVIVHLVACLACTGYARRILSSPEPPQKKANNGIALGENSGRNETSSPERAWNEIWNELVPPNASRGEIVTRILLAPVVLPIALIHMLAEQALMIILLLNRLAFNLIYKTLIVLPAHVIARTLQGCFTVLRLFYKYIFRFVWQALAKVVPYITRTIQRGMAELLWLSLKTVYHTVVFIFRTIEMAHNLLRRVKIYEVIAFLKAALFKTKELIQDPLIWIVGVATRVVFIVNNFILQPLILRPATLILQLGIFAMQEIGRGGNAVRKLVSNHVLRPLGRALQSVLNAIAATIKTVAAPFLRAFSSLRKPFLREGSKLSRIVLVAGMRLMSVVAKGLKFLRAEISMAMRHLLRGGRAVGKVAWNRIIRPIRRVLRTLYQIVANAIVTATVPIVRTLGRVRKTVAREGGRMRRSMVSLAGRARRSSKDVMQAFAQTMRIIARKLRRRR